VLTRIKEHRQERNENCRRMDVWKQKREKTIRKGALKNKCRSEGKQAQREA